jgi:hypothetical protein
VHSKVFSLALLMQSDVVLYNKEENTLQQLGLNLKINQLKIAGN